MLGRFIKSVVETIRPSPVKLEIVDDLRRRTFELGGEIEVTVAVTPKQDAVHVVEGSVTLVRELEIVRLIQTMIPDRKAAMGAHHRGGPVMIPKMVQEKSVDVHNHAAVVFARDEALGPDRITFPARLAVPEELPRAPSNVTNSTATWKLVATLELNDGSRFRAEQKVTERS